MKRRSGKSEQGIAMMSVLLALLVLSAIGAGLVFVTATETQVNTNYRSEQVAYFAAKAGMEEARSRMMANAPNSIYGMLPQAPPTDTNTGVLYIINQGAASGTVQPWVLGTAYTDDELCHDGYTLNGLQSQSTATQDIHCTTTPSNQTPGVNSWFQTVNSALPFSGTSGALPFVWVRIAMKLNGSIQQYPVSPAGAVTTPVCWNGSTEVLLNAVNCSSMKPTANPVYLVTALAVSATGARKMVQADVAATPSQPSPGFGLFAAGTGCGVVSLSGGVLVDSFNSAQGSYNTTKSDVNGNVGANGGVTLSGGVQVGGNVGAENANVGSSCPTDGIVTSGNGGVIQNQNPPNMYVAISPPLTPPAPPAIPNPTPTNNAANIPSNNTLNPGTYGNISLSGQNTLTLTPGVYYINSLSLSGQSTVKISPPGQVTLNVQGTGQNTPVSFSGGSFSNTTHIPNNFQINYNGTGTLKITGGADSYLVVDAPNAPVQLSGGSAIFGSIVGNSINDSGGVNFHVDTSAVIADLPPTANFVLISFRHVAY
jgi:Tfp pilus assembly protein PilX